MSFKIKNNNSQIYYYTVLIDKEQIQENRDDKPTMKLKPKTKPNSQKNRETLVYDRENGLWISQTMYRD